MGGLAAIAKSLDHKVTGCDTSVYPPMSTQLGELGIDIIDGWEPDQLALGADCYIVGNAVSRGNPLMEAILDKNLPYESGPQWLYNNVLYSKWTLGVAGTHGKTTTTAMLTKILDYAGLEPGFLIGGAPVDFEVTSRISESNFFVIEADEYDTAFFDKRSKFVHYRPKTLVLNNLEYDHADIFPNLSAIEVQFHHLLRTVPQSGGLIVNADSSALSRVLKRGYWSSLTLFGPKAPWSIEKPSGQDDVEILHEGACVGTFSPKFFGDHNLDNALAALLAARHCGVPISTGLEALSEYNGVRRRMELRAAINNISIYDDFAHHPTAISATVSALREDDPEARILAVFEPRSNTMKMGTNSSALIRSLAKADSVYCFSQDIAWDASALFRPLGERARVVSEIDLLTDMIVNDSREGDKILIMSNGGFHGIHGKIIEKLRANTR